MRKQKSLQRELNRWIVITALIFVLLGGLIAGGVAFYQARELQDHTLLEIARLIKAGKVNESKAIHHDIKKDTVIINELGEKQHVPIIPVTTADGFHTMELDDSTWRVFVTTQPGSKRRFSVAQQTKLRDKIAMASSLSVFLPIALLIIIMLLIIRQIIQRQFRSLSKLTKDLDQQDGMSLQHLPNKDIPIEVAPFVDSINGLLSRVNQAIKKQQRFIADAAHELRTPITALSLQVENLDKASTADAYKKRHNQLKLGLDRLRSLVVQLLDLARLQSEDEVSLETVSLNQIVQESIENLYPLAEKANIDLGVIKQEENIVVEDLQGRLHQLISNAISNAIHYTPQHGKIDISLYSEDGMATFVVEDTGIGIPEEELKLVKQPFYRVLESSQPGTGLGLAISHEIAQKLGGKIQLSNIKQGGLRFTYIQRLKKA